MDFKRTGLRLLVGTILAVILMNLIQVDQMIRIFIGAFGVGGGIILLIIASASQHDD